MNFKVPSNAAVPWFCSCSGEKLQALKAKLQEAMKLRRTEERQKRQALFKLDNEEMLEEDEEEEEEEEEMTDESEEEEEEEGDHEVCMQHFSITSWASPFYFLSPMEWDFCKLRIREIAKNSS